MTRWSQLPLIPDQAPAPQDPPPILAPAPEVSCPVGDLDAAKERLRKVAKKVTETKSTPSKGRKKPADPAYEAATSDLHDALGEYVTLSVDQAGALREAAIDLAAPVPRSTGLSVARALPKTWRFDARRGFRQWLTRLWQCGSLHGATLQDEMLVVSGHCHEMANVDDLLNECESYGWIVRGENAPTHSQRVFIGLQYGSTKRYHGRKNTDGRTAAQFHASHWYFSPNRECTEANEWLARSAA